MIRLSRYQNNPLSTLPNRGRLYKGLTDRELSLPVLYLSTFSFLQLGSGQKSITSYN